MYYVCSPFSSSTIPNRATTLSNPNFEAARSGLRQSISTKERRRRRKPLNHYINKIVKKRQLRDKINNRVLQEERRMQDKHHDLDLAKSRAEIVDKITASGENVLLAIQKLEELGAESVLTPNQKLQYGVR